MGDELMITDVADSTFKLVGRDIKCAAHTRLLDTHEYFSFALPQKDSSGKPLKKKASEGFTARHFLELEKNSAP